MVQAVHIKSKIMLLPLGLALVYLLSEGDKSHA